MGRVGGSPSRIQFNYTPFWRTVPQLFIGVNEDPSSPAPVSRTGNGALASGSFTPPNGSIIMVFGCGGWATALPQTLAITDSVGLTWHQLAMVSGTNTSNNGGVVAVWWAYVATSPGAMTTTLTPSATGGGVLNSTKVFSGANPDQSGATIITKNNSVTSDTAGTVSITTTQAGSLVYGVSNDSTTSATYALNGNTTNILAVPNSTDNVSMQAWKATNKTVTPGAITLGGTWSATAFYVIAAVEILPASAAVPTAVESGLSVLGVVPSVTPVQATVAKTVNPLGAVSSVLPNKSVNSLGRMPVGLSATVATARSDHPTGAVSALGIVPRTTTRKIAPQLALALIGTIPRVNHARGSGLGIVTNPATYASGFTTSTTPKTLSITVTAGDVLLITQVSGDPNNQVWATPTGGGLTYIPLQSQSPNGQLQVWSATAGTSQTFTMTAAVTANPFNTQWGFFVYQFTGVSAVGASATAMNNSVAPSIGLTTTVSHSAIFMVDVDANVSTSAATYLTGPGTFTELTHVTTVGGGAFTVWGGWYPDSGTAGAKTAGMSAPTQTYGIIVVELQPGLGGDNRAQIGRVALGAVGLASAKKNAAHTARGVVGLSAYRTIQTAFESGRALLGVAALVTPVKNAIVTVRAAVGLASRVTETKTVSTAAAGTVGAVGRATESRTAAVVVGISAGIIGRVAGLARTTPVIARAYGGVTARAIVAKAAPTALRTAAGVMGLSTPRKVAIVTDSAPIGLVALRSSAPSAIESGRGVIGLTVTVLTVKRSPVSVSTSVSVLGTARAAKSGAQHALSSIGATATARPTKLAVVAAYSSLGAIGRVLDAKSAPTTLRPAVGMVALSNPRKTASVHTSAFAGVGALTTVRKTVTLTARATAGFVPWVTPAKAVALRGVAVLGIAGTRTFVLPGWPPRPMAIALTRAMAAGVVYLTTPSTAAQTELTTTAATGTTELTEPARADIEVTRPAAADTEITH
jgi:hypothetical protein